MVILFSMNMHLALGQEKLRYLTALQWHMVLGLTLHSCAYRGEVCNRYNERFKAQFYWSNIYSTPCIGATVRAYDMYFCMTLLVWSVAFVAEVLIV